MLEAGLDSIDFLKVDIEGAETEVLESCPWIKTSEHDRVISLHDLFLLPDRGLISNTISSLRLTNVPIKRSTCGLQ
jgi:hypothetical protein